MQALRSFRICLTQMGELSFRGCLSKAQGELSVTEPGFVSVQVDGAGLVPSDLLLCLGSWLCSC